MMSKLVNLAEVKAAKKRKEVEAQYVAFYGNVYAMQASAAK